MKRKKKDLPLVVLRALEPFVSLRGDRLEIIDPGKNLLKAVDKDLDSSFHFTIERYEKDANGKLILLMTRNPKNSQATGDYQTWIPASDLEAQFNSWLKLLEEYESISSFFDDPIIKSYQEEYFAEFEIVEDDADVKPFASKQVLLLDSYLENVRDRLSVFVTAENSSEIEEIQNEIDNLRDSLTNKSKKWVVNGLSNIWARIAKQGPKFIKEFLSESKKEIVKQSVKGLLEFVGDFGAGWLN